MSTALCDKRTARAIRAYADEVHDGDWKRVTVAEARGVISALSARTEGDM